MAYITTTAKIEFDYSTVAKAFWEMDSDEQAKFFNCLAEILDIDFLKAQLDQVVDNRFLSKEGLEIMSIMFGSK